MSEAATYGTHFSIIKNSYSPYIWNLIPTVFYIFENEILAILIEGGCPNEEFIENAPKGPDI